MLLSARPPRHPLLLFFLSIMMCGGLGAAALLVEPWLADADQIGSWPPPRHGMFAAGLWVCYALLVPWVARAELQTGRARVGAYSLLLACVLRLAPLIVGLGDAEVRSDTSFLLAEPLALATAVVAAAIAVCCCLQARREPQLLTDGLQPLHHLNALSAEQLRVHINAGGTRTTRVVDADADDAASERVVPAGVGCLEAIRAFYASHKQMMEEASAIQKGEPYPPKKPTPRKPHADGYGGSASNGSTGNGEGGSGAAGEPPNPAKPAEPAEPAEPSPMSVLRRHLWKLCPKAPLSCGMVCSVVLTSTSFAAPYVQGKLFDAAVDAYHAKKRVDEAFAQDVAPLLAILGGLYGLSWVMEIFVGILFAVAAHTALTRLRCAMFANLVQQDVAFYDAHVSGELSSRLINDSGQLQTLVQFVTQDVLKAAVRIIGGVLAMYLTHPLLGLLATAITPINWLIIRKAGTVQGLYGAVQNASIAKANSAAIEALGCMRTVHANTGELREARRFASHIRRFLRVVLVTVHSQTVVIFTQLLLSQLRDVLVLGVGMHQVIAGEITIGNFTAFTQYVGLFEQGFSSGASIWLSVRQTLVSAGRFVQLLERRPHVRPGEGRQPFARCRGHLALQNVSFHYPASREALVLDSVSLEAPPGSIVALVGASGAGKSTIARLIERFYDPTSGALLLDGVDFRELELRWLRRQIGFVEQEPTLFDRSIAENVRYGAPEADDAQVQRAIELANAAEFISELPEGLETNPGERGVRLSGGQKQRIAIARAVLKQPALLLLDEATSALDSANEAAVTLALDRLMLERTTVVIAHRLSTVVRATQILVLSRGVVVERGTHTQLVADERSHYATFMKAQLVSPDAPMSAPGTRLVSLAVA